MKKIDVNCLREKVNNILNSKKLEPLVREYPGIKQLAMSLTPSELDWFEWVVGWMADIQSDEGYVEANPEVLYSGEFQLNEILYELQETAYWMVHDEATSPQQESVMYRPVERLIEKLERLKQK